MLLADTPLLFHVVHSASSIRGHHPTEHEKPHQLPKVVLKCHHACSVRPTGPRANGLLRRYRRRVPLLCRGSVTLELAALPGSVLSKASRLAGGVLDVIMKIELSLRITIPWGGVPPSLFFRRGVPSKINYQKRSALLSLSHGRFAIVITCACG